MFIRSLGIVTIAATLSSCGSVPVSQADAIPVPAERVLWSNVEGGYQIRVTRDSGSGIACMARIYLNGEPVADLKPREVVVFTVPEGRNLIGSSHSPASGGLCPGEKEIKRAVNVVDASGKAGDVLHFRFGFTATGPTVSRTMPN